MLSLVDQGLMTRLKIVQHERFIYLFIYFSKEIEFFYHHFNTQNFKYMTIRLRENCPNTELFLVRIFLFSD